MIKKIIPHLERLKRLAARMQKSKPAWAMEVESCIRDIEAATSAEPIKAPVESENIIV